jgi:NADH:ubiquinone oxidoreductase subunit 5 (subunit L)/multisubunit Na+/H+ antiporter MnhA subunit
MVPWIVKYLWLIPALPMLAAGLSALAPQRCRKFSASLAIGSMVGAFLLSLCAFARALRVGPDGAKEFFNFDWFQFAAGDNGILKLGWVLDPLAAVMLVMVSFVGLLIFIYSVGYMAHDENFTRFFTFLSLFAGAMLGVVIANSLLLLFVCWELVGLTSYLLIGFWYHKPSAAAAAKKAFITTRVGDVFFFLGMMWLYHETGTLLFYDGGAGCLEQGSLAAMVAKTTSLGFAVSTAIGLLIFAGAVGKSGQVPLHVWLPDAMEGPTPVSALIHAATMVAAGVFLVARVYPLMAVSPEEHLALQTSELDYQSLKFDSPSPRKNISVGFSDAEKRPTPTGTIEAPRISLDTASPDSPQVTHRYRHSGKYFERKLGPVKIVTIQDPTNTVVWAEAGRLVLPIKGEVPRMRRATRSTSFNQDQPTGVSLTLKVVTWIGAITALFAASIAVAQNDIKRILAYSTVSQLGYMMMGLGVGGVAVGMFHLITHAFFKALLFMGAGSVIHGCHEEQDIRRMGGIKKYMPVTFATYAVGMLALAGFPLVFSGFWSKDAILHAAHGWSVSHVPFYLGVAGAFLTAFYMTRQVALVFFGHNRSAALPSRSTHEAKETHDNSHAPHAGGRAAAEDSRAPHESPLVMTAPLVVLAVFAVVLGFVGTPAWPWFQTFLGQHHGEGGFTGEVIALMVISSLVVFAGLGLGWWLYGRKPIEKADAPDVLEKLPADLFTMWKNKYWIDEIYEKSVIAFNAWSARACAFLDEWVWGGLVMLCSYLALGLSHLNRAFDEFVINLGFDQSCEGVTRSGRLMSRLQDGRVQNYLRIIGVGLVALVLFLIWGGGK